MGAALAGGSVGGAMTIGELISSHRLILCTCHDCGGRTPIDPSLPARRLGRAVDLDTLKADMACPVCGSADVDLDAYAPAQHQAQPKAQPHAMAK
jgi:Zn finger protein HypA/HybF involved in hydrogenase expression